MGFFLVGAYQEILGDMHNLFGDTHSAVVMINDHGEAEITEISAGNSVEEMLRYVNLNPQEFKATYAELVDRKLPVEERESIFDELIAGLQGYTYLEDF